MVISSEYNGSGGEYVRNFLAVVRKERAPGRRAVFASVCPKPKMNIVGICRNWQC